MRTIASVGSLIAGSGTSSTRTSRRPWNVTAFMGWSPLVCSRPHPAVARFSLLVLPRSGARETGAVSAAGARDGRTARAGEALSARLHALAFGPDPGIQPLPPGVEPLD